MGFDPAIMSAALNRLRREKDRREAERERLTQEIYAKEPRQIRIWIRIIGWIFTMG